MFWTSESHQLSQKDICDALWPKKDDPSETLYTLIRRLKPTIENNSRIKIESDRGRGYRLTM
jgi:DNA-binding response OmpR family regulator